MPIYTHFLQKVYTVEECRRCALPLGSPSLASIIDEEADSICHDTVVLTPKLPAGATMSFPNAATSSSASTSSGASKLPITQPAASLGAAKQKSPMTSASCNAGPSSTNSIWTTSAPTRYQPTGRMSTGEKPPKPNQQPTSSTTPTTSQKPAHKHSSAQTTAASASQKLPHTPQISQKDRSARYTLAGSSKAASRDDNEVSCSNASQAKRPRSASSPPSSMSTKPTPPRATHSPTPLSPITIPSSPAMGGSGRRGSPFTVDVPSPNVRQAAEFKKGSTCDAKRSKGRAEDVDPVGDLIADMDNHPKPYDYEPDSNSVSAPVDRRQKKKARVTASMSTGPSFLPATAPAPSLPTHTLHLDVVTPNEAPPYIAKILELARMVGIDEDFRRLLRLFLRIERAADYQENGRLSSLRRPNGVKAWIAQAHAPGYCPDMSDLRHYYDEFLAWFKVCMPDWRKDQKKGIRLTRDPNGNWEFLRITGQNGIVSLIAAIAWWKEAVDKLPVATAHQIQEKLCLVDYEGAMDELIYCFSGLAKGL
ncbi:hypothetical protein VNI00_016483 [Paramarasmius palmivorus]|uniref:Uncharacterized protein n=1 Tax=Paramarasmius palmivorus TaxID=297713 RepID=A0AAW0BDU3_9AGAR